MSKKYKPTGWLSASRMRSEAVFIIEILDRIYAHRERFDTRPEPREIVYLEETLKHAVKWLKSYYKDMENELYKGEIPQP